MLTHMNNVRRQAGLAPLTLAPGITDVSRRWALQLATTRRLAHNPNFVAQVAASGSWNWRSVAENVGYGSACNILELFLAYMHSPGHRANIMDPHMRYVGIGMVDRTDPSWHCGIVYNAVNFVDAYSTGYGSIQMPPWGVWADRRAPSGPASMAAFETGRDQRASASSSAGLSINQIVYGQPSPQDDAVHISLQSRSSANSVMLYSIRDSWDLSGTTKLLLKANTYNALARPLQIEVWAIDYFNRAVMAGRVNVPPGITTLQIPLPPSARAFTNMIQFRVLNSSVRALGSYQGHLPYGVLHLYSLGAP
jgi:hypothetical protein